MFAQITALIIFIAMFIFIVMDKIQRHIVTLIAGLLTCVLVFGVGMHSFDAVKETLNLHSIVSTHFWYSAGAQTAASTGINWETIIFIAGMMIMVEGMAEAGFFRWLCMRIAKAVHYKPIAIFMTFMLLSAVLAMFIDSITVILFLAAVTIELARLLRFDPVPFILAEIFCANLGGSATMCGDPPNIIIGTSLGYSFGDFLTNTGEIALVGMLFTLLYFYLVFGKSIKKQTVSLSEITVIEPRQAITDKGKFIASCVIFGAAVVLLVSHAATGLTVSTIGVFVAVLTILTHLKNAGEILKKVKGERYRSELLNKLGFGRNNERIENCRTEYDWISRDEEIVEKYAADELCTFVFTVNGFINLAEVLWYVSNDKWYTNLRKDLPLLLLAGDADPVGNYGKGVRSVYEKLCEYRCDASMKLYEGARHELLNELCREEVYGDILEFISANLFD